MKSPRFHFHVLSRLTVDDTVLSKPAPGPGPGPPVSLCVRTKHPLSPGNLDTEPRHLWTEKQIPPFYGDSQLMFEWDMQLI